MFIWKCCDNFPFVGISVNRSLLNQTMMSNRWDAAFSRFVSCPNDKTGVKLTAKGGTPGGSD